MPILRPPFTQKEKPREIPQEALQPPVINLDKLTKQEKASFIEDLNQIITWLRASVIPKYLAYTKASSPTQIDQKSAGELRQAITDRPILKNFNDTVYGFLHACREKYEPHLPDNRVLFQILFPSRDLTDYSDNRFILDTDRLITSLLNVQSRLQASSNQPHAQRFI